MAKHCLETWPEKSVVVLEAREFCSGATGRNAGHCKPDQCELSGYFKGVLSLSSVGRGFGKYEKAFGTDQALQV